MIPMSARNESATTDDRISKADADALFPNSLPTSFISSVLALPAPTVQANSLNPFPGQGFPVPTPSTRPDDGQPRHPIGQSQGQSDGEGDDDGHPPPVSITTSPRPLVTTESLSATPSQATSTITTGTAVSSDGVPEIPQSSASPSFEPLATGSVVTVITTTTSPSSSSVSSVNSSLSATSTAVSGADTGSSRNSFFSNKAAVIGTFTTAGIILLLLIAVCAFRLSHRRRLRREEKSLDMENDKIIADFAEKTLLDAQNNKPNAGSNLMDGEGARQRTRINLDDPNPNIFVTRTVTKKEIPVTQDGRNGGWTEKSKPPPESLGYGYGYGYGYNNAKTMDAPDYGNHFNTGPGPVVENQNHPNYGLTSLGSGPTSGIPYPSSSNAQGKSPYQHAKFPNPYEHTHPITHTATSWNQSSVSLSQEPMKVPDTYAYGGISHEYEGLSTRRI
ncbi:hypothetical protein D9758_009094 [Tetrapyrgos nigripes]|uniref:Uncharacterized protein n=1 Tax=Tetrapyrgos nigripes TaxID=182062 RepID=A0A8H5GA68_9AGAR|nr:hypothetical protein D9758_009094 [Tetrapyrgos nigripes]